MRAIVILLLVLGCTSFAQANDYYSDIMSKADSSYRSGNFEDALTGYRQILDAGFSSSDLYYNLANSYYKLGEIPESVLYFEKALKANPDDADAAFNLEIANGRIIDEISPLPTLFYEEWLQAFRNSFTSKGWGIISIIVFHLFAGSLLLYLLTKQVRVKKLAFVAIVFFGTITLISFRLGRLAHSAENNSDFAIIFTPSVDMFSEPSEDATKIFVIHEGLKVGVESTVGSWAEIVLPDGNKGWIPVTSLQYI